MYDVKLINGEEETHINIASTNKRAPRITGTIHKEINAVDDFSFLISVNNPGIHKINALSTLVEVINTKTNELEFKGRVLLPVPNMDSNGLISMKVTCESELGYLMDSIAMYAEFHDISVRDYLSKLIENHNNQVSADKRFEVGIIEITANLYRFWSYGTTLETIKEDLIDKLGGEIRIRYENNVRYLDYLNEIGSHSNTEIRLAKNLITLEQEQDPTELVTRLIPLGSKLEDSDERLTIGSINNGLNYIDDTDLISKFGIIVKTETWDDVTEQANLLRKGQEFLKNNNKIKKAHKVSALDLSLIGLDFESFKVGNYHPVINELMGIDEDLRIVAQKIVIESPESSDLTIGDEFVNLKDYQLKADRTQKKLEKVSDTLNGTVNAVTNVTTEVINLNGVVTDTVENLGNTNDNLLELTKSIQSINDNTNAALRGIEELKKNVEQISIELNNDRNTLIKIQRRLAMGV